MDCGAAEFDRESSIMEALSHYEMLHHGKK